MRLPLLSFECAFPFSAAAFSAVQHQGKRLHGAWRKDRGEAAGIKLTDAGALPTGASLDQITALVLAAA